MVVEEKKKSNKQVNIKKLIWDLDQLTHNLTE